MPRYKIEIEYDGTNYCGWQKQKDQISIQEIIENSLLKSFNQKVEVIASGRTDAGVHALGQIAHFDLDKNLNEFQMMMAINQNISFTQNVVITNCKVVSNEFHSRFDAKMRFYQYKIINRKAPLTLDKNRAWHVAQKLDLDKIVEASKYLLGQHDFSSFRDTECQAQSPIKTLNKIEISKIGEKITFEVSAKSFLHHMVRNIVGTLILVGKGKIAVADMKKILEAKDRKMSGPNAPACGLYFLNVEY